MGMYHHSYELYDKNRRIANRKAGIRKIGISMEEVERLENWMILTLRCIILIKRGSTKKLSAEDNGLQQESNQVQKIVPGPVPWSNQTG